MKLNGALKPRQGASKQGSSPGVVFKKYRIKRYFMLNENVAKSLPLHERGEETKTLIKKQIINRKNICINQCNQQQPGSTPLSQQLDTNRKRGEIFSSSISSRSLSRIHFPTLIKTGTQNNLTSAQLTIQTRVAAIKKTKACHGSLNSPKNNIKQILASIAGAEAVRAELNKTKSNIKVDFEQKTEAEAVCNITTRQVNNTKLNEEKTKNKIHNVKSDNKKTKVVKSNVTPNKSHNNKNNTTPKEVNKFLFIPNINESLIWRLFIQLKLLLLSMFSHAIKPFNGNPLTHCVSGGDCVFAGYNLVKMMRATQLLERICFKNARGLKPSVALCLVIYAAISVLFPQPVAGDDGDTFFPINGLETTTPEFDYASRGQKKFGDKCENTLECGFPGSICDPKKKSCQCTEDLPVTNHIDKCGKEAAVNESCFFNEQCEVKYFQTECRDQRCVCRFDMTPVWLKDGSVECKGRGDKKGPETYIDPAMIGVLVGMALMFIIICVVLRLFSQARWRENRTIFNTPNPRLMNVSLLRESKLLHGQERRGSRMSVRAPSRQPSMASLRPHSPNPSLGKTGSRSNSHGSNASATSIRSTRSNSVSPAGVAVGNNSHHERKGSTYQPHQHQHPQQQKIQPLHQQQEEQQHLTQTNIISNPVAETVTVEIIEPEK